MPGRSATAVEVHDQQAGDFAKRYVAYAEDAYQSCFAYSRMRLAQALERDLPVDGSGLRALDVGCGTGHHLRELVERGFDAAGTDGSPAMLAEARRMNPEAELYQADVEALPFPDSTFDLVLCIEVLRYLRDPRASIAEMARVLRPGGVCLATVSPLFSVNGYPLVNRLALVLPRTDLVRLKQYFVTQPHARRQFGQAGFASVELEGVYTGPINWVERLMPGRLRSFLRRWEHIDRQLADRPTLRGFSNMLLVKAVRAA